MRACAHWGTNASGLAHPGPARSRRLGGEGGRRHPRRRDHTRAGLGGHAARSSSASRRTRRSHSESAASFSRTRASPPFPLESGDFVHERGSEQGLHFLPAQLLHRGHARRHPRGRVLLAWPGRTGACASSVSIACRRLRTSGTGSSTRERAPQSPRATVDHVARQHSLHTPLLRQRLMSPAKARGRRRRERATCPSVNAVALPERAAWPRRRAARDPASAPTGCTPPARARPHEEARRPG
jgi:hypothetical protein